jgi:hypothetical protein
MAKQNGTDNSSDDEVTRRIDDALRRALSTVASTAQA